MHVHHVARCFNCGKEWIVGDCVPAFCSERCEHDWRNRWESETQRKKAGTSEPEHNDDPIYDIRVAMAEALRILEVPNETHHKRIVDLTVDLLPDFFRQPLMPYPKERRD